MNHTNYGILNNKIFISLYYVLVKGVSMLKKMVKSFDYSLIAAMFILCTFGLLMVYSSSYVVSVARYELEPDFFFQRQKLAMIIGTIVFMIAVFIPYKLYSWKPLLMCIVALSFLLLILVLFTGHTAGNAQSWFKLGSRSFQPSEYVKMAVIVYLASAYANKQRYLNDDFIRGVIPPIIFVGLVCFFVILQPDFGTAFIIFSIASLIVLTSGMNMKSILKLGGITFVLIILFGLALLLSGKLLSTERLSRFTGFLNPFDPEVASDAGYQLINSYFAIASGGLSGVGLGQSVQKFGYLPEPHTDFIMAVIAEELGLLGVLIVLVPLFWIIIRGLVLAKRCNDPFGSLLAIGICSMIGIQSFINIGGLTGLIPITGVPLPLISYGGSSLVLLMGAVGVLVNISCFVNLHKKKRTSKSESNKVVTATFS
jgi:cell division protein FtsW